MNNLGQYGRCAFAELTELHQIEADFEARVGSEFDKLIDAVASDAAVQASSLARYIESGIM
jgi:type III restriction enzyme